MRSSKLVAQRAIGLRRNRGAMDTSFGTEVDPDEVGRAGHAVDGAMDLYETFHTKQPIRVVEMAHDLPAQWVCVGDALAVMYRTDKWHADGDDEDYKHLHDKSEDTPYEVRRGVRFYEPAEEVRRSRHGRQPVHGGRVQRLSVAAPRAITLLGRCLGAFVRLDETGENYEVDMSNRHTYLFAAPTGKALYIYSPREGFLAAMCGGGLRVLKDGIDG